MNKLKKLIYETVLKTINESKMNFDYLYYIDNNTDITQEVKTYLSWSQMGETNPMFSIESSKLHDALMFILSLNHEIEGNRKAFAKMLNYIRCIDKRVGIQSIIYKRGNLLLTTNLKNDFNDGEIIIDPFDFLYNELPYLHEYGIIYTTEDGVIYGNHEYREGSDNGSSGYVITDAKMTDEMRNYIHSLGLVPALYVTGSYHENWIYSVGVLPEMVSQFKQDEDYEDVLFFDCQFSDY